VTWVPASAGMTAGFDARGLNKSFRLTALRRIGALTPLAYTTDSIKHRPLLLAACPNGTTKPVQAMAGSAGPIVSNVQENSR
jgi:hypothetical protein